MENMEETELYSFLDGQDPLDFVSANLIPSFDDESLGGYGSGGGGGLSISSDELHESPSSSMGIVAGGSGGSKVASRKLHPHHGTNASSDAAGKIRKHHCSFPNCGKEFSTSGHLARHNRIHTGEKNYACSECGARFSRQDNCNQHTKSHTKLSRKSSLSCGGNSRKADTSRADLGIDSTTTTSTTTATTTTTTQQPKQQLEAAAAATTSTTGSPSHVDLTSRILTTNNNHPRPMPSHNVSYAGSLVTSEAGGYASSSTGNPNDSDLSPTISAYYDIGKPVHFAELPGSLYDGVLDGVRLDPSSMTAMTTTSVPPLVYDSSAAETDESYGSFQHNNNNGNDFISEEDFYSWSAGVLFQPAAAASATAMGMNAAEHDPIFSPHP